MKKIIFGLSFLVASNVLAKDLSKSAYVIVPNVDVHAELSAQRNEPGSSIPVIKVDSANMVEGKMFDEVLKAVKPYSALIAFDQSNTLKLTCHDLGVKKHNSDNYRCLKDNGQNDGGWAEGVGAWIDGSSRPTYYHDYGYGDVRLHATLFCLCTDEKISNLPIDSKKDQEVAEAKYNEAEKNGADDATLDAIQTPFDQWYDSIPQYGFEGRMGMSKLIERK